MSFQEIRYLFRFLGIRRSREYGKIQLVGKSVSVKRFKFGGQSPSLGSSHPCNTPALRKNNAWFADASNREL